MDNKKPNIDIVAQLDQMTTTLENSATMLGVYYKRLISEGIPDELAYELVIDFHALLFSKINKANDNG